MASFFLTLFLFLFQMLANRSEVRIERRFINDLDKTNNVDNNNNNIVYNIDNNLNIKHINNVQGYLWIITRFYYDS